MKEKIQFKDNQERKQYRLSCEKALINELRDISVNLSENTVANISQFEVVFGVNENPENERDYTFGSEITIYMHDSPRIQISSCGAFSPNDEKRFYSKCRYLNAAEVIVHWNEVIPIIQKFHAKVLKLYNRD